MTVRTSLLTSVRDRLRDRNREATDSRVTVGSQVLLVEVSHSRYGRLAGVAHRPPGSPPDAWPSSVEALASLAVESSAHLPRAVGIATLNALSAPDVDWRGGDPMAALADVVEVIATVGLFRPAFRKFDDVAVRIVERDPPESIETPDGVSAQTYSPTDADRAFDGADVCFVTGSTLVYGGIDRYLRAATEADVPLSILIGSTASMHPAPAFAAGVDVLAGAEVADPDRVRERVRAGDCDTDLHDVGLRKGYVTASEDLPGLTLLGGTESTPTNP